MGRVTGGDVGVAEADAELSVALAALRHGNVAGLETIARHYQITALRLAFGILGDRESAEDVVSDSLVTAFQRIKQFDAMRPFAPWFYRIVINAAKKSRRRRSIESRAYRRLSTAASSVDATAEALAADERREVFAAVQALATEERVVVVLHYYLEASISDTVDLLGWPSGTVKRRLYNARQRLRARLGRRLGVELDEKEVGQWFASATQTPR